MTSEELVKWFVSWSARTKPRNLIAGGVAAFFIVTMGYLLITTLRGSKSTSNTKTSSQGNSGVQVERSLINTAVDAFSGTSDKSGAKQQPEPFTLNPGPLGESAPSERISASSTQKLPDNIQPVTAPDIVNSAQNQQEVLSQRIRELSGKIAEIESSIEGASSKLLQLKTSSEGRKIASDQGLLEGLFLLIDGTPDSKEQVLPLKDELSILKSAFIASTSTNDFPKLRDSISTLTKKSSELAIKAESLRKSVANFVQMGAANAENASTVQQLMDQRDFQLTMQAAADAEAVRKKARERIAEADRNAVESETQRQLSERNAKIAADRIQIEKNEFEKEFLQDLREIELLLAPFITPATNKFVSERRGSYYFYPSSPVKQPFSLKSLQVFGALESTPDGFAQILTITTSSNLLRPLGSFPNIGGTEWRQNPEAKRKIERAQFLLQKYGSLLVEKALLEP